MISHEKQSDKVAHGAEFKEREEIWWLDDSGWFWFDKEGNEVKSAVQHAQEHVSVEREDSYTVRAQECICSRVWTVESNELEGERQRWEQAYTVQPPLSACGRMDKASSTCEKMTTVSRQNAAAAFASFALSANLSWPCDCETQRRMAVAAAATEKFMASLSFEANIAERSCTMMLVAESVRALHPAGLGRGWDLIATRNGRPRSTRLRQLVRSWRFVIEEELYGNLCQIQQGRMFGTPVNALIWLSCGQRRDGVALRRDELGGCWDVFVDWVE
jgi:hypothetical protein